MSLVFQIEDLDTEVFVSSFSLLTPIQKEIFRKFQFLSQKFPSLYVSQARIAVMVGCCRKTVNEAIKEFVEYGWVTKIYRHYRTCLYMVKENLKWFNPIKWLSDQWEDKSKIVNKIWSKVTLRVTQVLNTMHKYDSYDPIQKIPSHLRDLACDQETKMFLSIFPEDVFREALKRCKGRKCSNQVQVPGKYMFTTCQDICKKRKIRPKWELLNAN